MITLRLTELLEKSYAAAVKVHGFQVASADKANEALLLVDVTIFGEERSQAFVRIEL